MSAFAGKADIAATPAKPERRPVRPLRHQKHLRGNVVGYGKFWQWPREVKLSGTESFGA